MKRLLIPIVGILVVLTVAWVCFAQPEEGERPDRARGGERRRGMWREEQLKAIAAAEEQLAQIKSGLESVPRVEGSWRDLPDEERDKLREKFMQLHEKQQKSIAAIEEQIAKLKGGRQLRDEHQRTIDELNAIRELAKKENAQETLSSIEKLIAEKQKQFEDNMQELGIWWRPRGERD